MHPLKKSYNQRCNKSAEKSPLYNKRTPGSPPRPAVSGLRLPRFRCGKVNHVGKHVDESLVKRARLGDREAFSQLYADMSKALCKTAYCILGNQSDAEDVVMDTVADAYIGISKLRDTGAFEGWIYKILYNKARRLRGITIFRATDELPLDLADPAANTDMRAELMDVRAAFSRLSVEERTIVVLSVCHGYTSAEISSVTGLNPNTVRSKQSRAIAKMRDCINSGEGGTANGKQ